LLWNEEDEFSARLGLAGAALHADGVIVVESANSDSRYVQQIDDPNGTGEERLLAIAVRSPSGENHAVVVLARSSTLRTFTQQDIEVATLWAEQAGPLFHMMHLESRVDAANAGPEIAGHSRVYRHEALARLARGEDPLATFLWRLPWYLRNAHYLGLSILLLLTVLFAFVKVGEYASGPAYIAAENQIQVAATRDGVIEEVIAEPGMQVSEGQVLARLAAQAEQAELSRAQTEVEQALIARLREPSDRELEEAVAQARTNEARARAGIEETLIRAPRAGRVGDVRSMAGRSVQSGQTIATIVDDANWRRKVRALIPARFRPALAKGQRLVFEIEGIAQAPQLLEITSISDQAVGTEEMLRILGPQFAGALRPRGPMVVVEAMLPNPEIVVDGRRWRLHHGMVGQVDIKIDDKPIAYHLVPGLERAFAGIAQ
jgi:biotin carboxyl carrier protein